uniref:Protein kinase domain-containing protein n=1 Tax=Parascaris univalens TaxID=6257 RepID=A0A915CEI2_PARUN
MEKTLKTEVIESFLSLFLISELEVLQHKHLWTIYLSFSLHFFAVLQLLIRKGEEKHIKIRSNLYGDK